MDYKDELKAIGLDVTEKIIIKVLIPFLEQKVKDSSNVIDDAILEALKPALIEFVDKLDGEEDVK